MKSNIKIIFVTVAIYATTTNSTCKKEPVCGDNNTYTFINNNARAYPDNDSLRIGDTLFIDITMPTTLRDNVTNLMIDFSEAVSVGNSPGVGQFTGGSVSDPGVIGAVNKFNYSVINGQLVNGSIRNERMQFFFDKINDSFYLKIAVIPKLAGIYFFSISEDAGVYRKGDNCTKAAFEFRFFNTDQHLYFYQNNRPGYVISDYEFRHMYCFKVY